MSLDHAQSLRLGQKGVAPTPGVQLVALASLPEVAYRGQIVYLLDLDEFRVYDGDAWQVPTAAVQAGTQTFVGPDEPVADKTGDLWMKNTTYQLFIWDGATWREVQDPTADAAATNASQALTNAQAALDKATVAQAAADGKIETFYQPLAPAPGVEDPHQGDLWFRTTDNRAFIYDPTATPSWVEIQDTSIVTALEKAGTAQSTADQKISSYYLGDPPWPDGTAGHGNDIGDLWFDISDNKKPYRWDGSWIPVRDATIAIAQSAAEAAQSSADGKNTIYRQTTQPTTGKIGDTWFNSSLDNQIWVHNGTTWVASQLGTNAILDSSIVNAKIADATIDNAKIANLDAGKITTGTLQADLTLSALLRTGLAPDARVEIGPFGIKTYDQFNTVQSVFPTGAGEMNSFTGSITATGATVNGGFTLRLTNNEISRGAAITLASGVTPSQNQPTVTVDWDSIHPTLATGSHATDGHGLVFKDGKWWTAEYDAPNTYLVSYDPGTGAEVDRIALTGGAGAPYRPIGGLCWSGASWFTLNQSLFDSFCYLVKWSPTGAFQNGSRYLPLTGNGVYQDQYSFGYMAIAWKATSSQVVVAEYDSANQNFRLDYRNAISCASDGVVATTAQSGFGGPVGGMAIGNFDYGAERMAILGRNNTAAWIFSAPAGFPGNWVYQAVESFPTPTTAVTGFGWDGTRFATARFYYDSSTIYYHTNITWTSGTAGPDGNWWVGFTWYDSTSSPLHETLLSPLATKPMTKRARYTVTTPTIPTGQVGDPNSVRVYVGRGSTAPGRTALWLQGSFGPQTQTFSTVTFAGTNPPSLTNFGTSSPALLTNAAGTLAVSGDGSGKFSGITIGADPVVSQAAAQTLTNKNLASATNTLPGNLVTAGAAGLTIRAGNVACTGAQTIVVTHGLGTTPSFVLLTVLGTTSAYWAICTARTTTTFTITMQNTTNPTTPVWPTAGTLSFSWLAGF